MKFVPNKDMHMSAEKLKSWPYWKYGHYGTDGCDWRSYVTGKGPMDIPDYAEEATPLTPEQALMYGLK